MVNEAQVDVFLKFSSFFNDPVDVGNLISGSFTFCKSSWNIWKFSVYMLLKPSLENFEHYFASVWDECSCAAVWTFFGIAFLWMKTDLFPSYGHCWVFQIYWHIECSILTVSSFRIWNSSAGVPSPPLGLFVVMHPKAHLTSHSRRSGSRLVITPCGYLGHICIVLLCILVPSSWYLLLLLGLYHFCLLLCPFLHEIFPWYL